MYKGQLEGFPTEIVEKMLDYQEQQGNERDISVFEKDIFAGKRSKGFIWDETLEGADFWNEVIEQRNFQVFFDRYPKYPKVMWVGNYPINGYNEPIKRVVFMEKNGKFIAWSFAETLKEAETITTTVAWSYAKDVELDNTEIVEVTLEDVAKAMNIDVDKLRIKKYK